MALAGAKLFVEEGAHVFISGRRQEALDEAVKLIGRNVTGVQADSANLDDLDRLFDAVRREKGTTLERRNGRIRPNRIRRVTRKGIVKLFENTCGSVDVRGLCGGT